jgi:hypothetical protein
MLSFLVVGRGLLAVGAAALFAAAAKALRGLYTYKYQVPGLMVRLSGSALVSVVKYVVRGRKPRFPEWTFASELEQGVLRSISAHCIAHMVKPENAAYLRDTMEASVKQSSDTAAHEAACPSSTLASMGSNTFGFAPRMARPSRRSPGSWYCISTAEALCLAARERISL